MVTRAFIFPGQGSQAVGMGREVHDAFPEARETFQEVDEALKQKLSQLIFNGPIEELTRTENAQPALMATSLAIFRALMKQGNLELPRVASCVAGHSLGEYSALAAAGSLTVSDTARLLRIRGAAMQQAVPEGKGAMAAIIGVDLPAAEKIASAASSGVEICQVANDNSDGQVVISGSAEAVRRAEAIAKEHGAKRFVLLNVSAPFHCELMQPAAERMREALALMSRPRNSLDELRGRKDTSLMNECHVYPGNNESYFRDMTLAEIRKPAVPVIANVTAAETSSPEEIRRLLVEQVTGRVRWRESVACMSGKGVNFTVEIGAGKVLSGLTKRIVKDMEAVSIQMPQDIEVFLKTL